MLLSVLMRVFRGGLRDQMFVRGRLIVVALAGYGLPFGELTASSHIPVDVGHGIAKPRVARAQPYGRTISLGRIVGV